MRRLIVSGALALVLVGGPVGAHDCALRHAEEHVPARCSIAAHATQAACTGAGGTWTPASGGVCMGAAVAGVVGDDPTEGWTASSPLMFYAGGAIAIFVAMATFGLGLNYVKILVRKIFGKLKGMIRSG